jgi:hypothetical protein
MFTDDSGRAVIHFSPGITRRKKLRDAFKTQATVAIEKASLDIDHRDILLSFGMYLLTMHEDDNTAVLIAAMG